LYHVSNQRQYRRAVLSAPAQVTLVDCPAGPDGKKPVIVVRVADISATGLRIDVPGILGLDTMVKVSFTTEAGRRVSVVAKVVRIDGNDLTRLVSHGLMREVDDEKG
jgi:hypothetical protein